MNFIAKHISATCIEYSFGSKINKKCNDIVLKVYRLLPQLLDLKKVGIVDIVPSYTALAIHFNTSCELLKDMNAFNGFIEKALKQKHRDTPLHHTIYVDYNGEDLDEVCQKLELSKDTFIDLHASSYSIAMIGFREYFPYLLGLNNKLYLPRRDNPRSKVKKGSVAIAAGQTGIYPQDSPGGWHIIGHTDFDDFSSLRPSDIVIFKNKDKYAH
ncbi:carboxyltransferase domain-containing protein [Campylobacterota bacterium]